MMEGSDPSHVYFLVHGKLQVSKGGAAVAVLGPGACFGDWGVIAEHKAKVPASSNPPRPLRRLPSKF